MAALFALGVMSLGWMAFIAALIAVEKLLPWKAVANRGIAVLLLALGLALAFAPASVPGLTVPGSAEAMPGMDGGSMSDGSMGEGSMSEESMNDAPFSDPREAIALLRQVIRGTPMTATILRKGQPQQIMLDGSALAEDTEAARPTP